MSLIRRCLLGALMASTLALPGSEGWAGAVARGDSLAAQHRLLSAAGEYQEAARQPTAVPTVSIRLGQLYLRLGRWGEAADLLRQAEASGAASREVMLGLATALDRMGDGRSSLAVLRRELELRPDRVGVGSRLVEQAARLGLRPREIEDLLAGLPIIEPEGADDPRSAYLVGACLLQPESAEGRFALQRAALGPDPTAAAAARELLAAADVSGAEDRAITVARVLLAQGLLGPALAHLEGVEADGPREAEALALKGYAMMRLGSLDEAEAALRRSLELAPGQALGEHFMGALLRLRGDPEGAVHWLERAARREPGNPALLAELARALVDLGDYGNAEKALRLAVEAAPEDVELRLAVTRFHVDRQYRVESALPDAREAVRLSGRSAESLGLLGWATHLSGASADALGLLKEAVERDPESALLRYRLGSVYEALGQPERAREQYLMVQELDGTGEQWKRARVALDGL